MPCSGTDYHLGLWMMGFCALLRVWMGMILGSTYPLQWVQMNPYVKVLRGVFDVYWLHRNESWHLQGLMQFVTQWGYTSPQLGFKDLLLSAGSTAAAAGPVAVAATMAMQRR